MTIAPYKCCPDGVEVDVDGLATGKLSSIMCLHCGRWFIGPKSAISRGQMDRIAGDVFIDPDGSFHTQRKAIRDLIAEHT